MLASIGTGTVFSASVDTAHSAADSQSTEALQLEQAAATHLTQQ